MRPGDIKANTKEMIVDTKPTIIVFGRYPDRGVNKNNKDEKSIDKPNGR
jgi:hypothetical protein